ncbi:MAG: hypothetical protein WBP81_39180 [Solirubrobacteraceae bacterium]
MSTYHERHWLKLYAPERPAVSHRDDCDMEGRGNHGPAAARS